MDQRESSSTESDGLNFTLTKANLQTQSKVAEGKRLLQPMSADEKRQRVKQNLASLQ